MRLYAYLNTNVPAGKTSKALIQHGDIKAVSIYAKNLRKNPYNKDLIEHGDIQEVSIVLAGANPKAKIDYIALEHSDGSVELDEDEAEIYNGYNIDEIYHDNIDHSDNFDSAVNDVMEIIQSELTDLELDEVLSHYDENNDENNDENDDISDEELDNIVDEAIDEAIDDMSDEEVAEIAQSIFDDEELDDIIMHSELSDIKNSLTDDEEEMMNELISIAEKEGTISPIIKQQYRDRYYQLSRDKQLFLDYILNLVLKGE